MKVLANLGLALGGLNYLVTTGFFFSNGQTGLGLIQLLVPPAELVLPWLASPTLGVISLISLAMVIIGAWSSAQKDH
jgi:hypothetical protein